MEEKHLEELSEEELGQELEEENEPKKKKVIKVATNNRKKAIWIKDEELFPNLDELGEIEINKILDEAEMYGRLEEFYGENSVFVKQAREILGGIGEVKSTNKKETREAIRRFERSFAFSCKIWFPPWV